jgi:hypothetical protein
MRGAVEGHFQRLALFFESGDFGVRFMLPLDL